MFRDVTQRREVDRMKSEFVSMVSHELRTPLTAIRGSLGLLSGGALGPLTANADRMVEIALISSERLTRLIDEILDIERIESGVMTVDLADYSAEHLIEAAVGQVQVLAAEAKIQVVVGPVDGKVRADADRVVQTLLNLLGNAIKFSLPATTVRVSAEPRGNFVEFAICDQGRGIPEDKLDAIFGRFEQVDSSDAREKGGSGLGLAISRSLVERLGGRIWATNNAGPRRHLPVHPAAGRDCGTTGRAAGGPAPIRVRNRPAQRPFCVQIGRVGGVGLRSTPVLVSFTQGAHLDALSLGVDTPFQRQEVR